MIRAILLCCVRVRLLQGFPSGAEGGFILAINHNSHLDAHVLSGLLPREVSWLSRVEFFRSAVPAFLLHAVGAIPIHRQGVPLRALHRAIETLRAGRNIGICPEGEVRSGPGSVVYGGRIKRGVGFLAHRARAPVIPCVILGVQPLCRVGPWLPARRGQVWLSFGTPIYPRMDLRPKEARENLSRELETQFCDLFRQIEQRYPLPGDAMP